MDLHVLMNQSIIFHHFLPTHSAWMKLAFSDCIFCFWELAQGFVINLVMDNKSMPTLKYFWAVIAFKLALIYNQIGIFCYLAFHAFSPFSFVFFPLLIMELHVVLN